MTEAMVSSDPTFPAAAALTRRRNMRAWSGLVACLVLVTAAFLVVWNNGLRNRFFPKAFRVVVPQEVYASGQINRHLIGQTLDQYSIKEVVSLTDDGPNQPDEQAERQVCADQHIAWVCYPLAGDGTGDIAHYADTVQAVVAAEQAHEPILVHCFSGAQRTRGWIAFFRLLVEHRPPAEVESELDNRTWPEPANAHLIPYLNAHMREMAQMLVDRHVIDHVPDPLPQLQP